MNDTDILQSFFLIFGGAAVIATTALYLRQPMLVAYIALGALAGPSGLTLEDDTALLSGIAEIGIIFLLFLVGLDLPTHKLKNMLGESLLTALGTTAVFFSAGAGVMLVFGYTATEALIVGIAMTFSSTILGIKLLPTTMLHHRHIGEIVISLLLVQTTEVLVGLPKIAITILITAITILTNGLLLFVYELPFKFETTSSPSLRNFSTFLLTFDINLPLKINMFNNQA